MLQEKCDDGAIKFASSPPEHFSPALASVALCHAYIAVPASKETEPNRQQALDKMLSAYSDNATVVQAIADCSFMAGNYDKAVQAYERALAIDPVRKLAKNNLALALAELPNRASEAHQVLSSALSKDSKSPDLLDTEATLHLIENQPEQAIAILEQLTKQNPDNAVTWLHLALAYHELKNSERRARACLSRPLWACKSRSYRRETKRALQNCRNATLFPKCPLLPKHRRKTTPNLLLISLNMPT